MLNVLVVGQTPPPYHGQAIMIKRLLDCQFENLSVNHVPMAFSKNIDEVGSFRLKKMIHLAGLIPSIAAAKLKYGSSVLYYPPAGPDIIPIYRDLAILLAVRPLFKHTIFHFHAGGVSEMLPRLSTLEQMLFRRAYFGADGAIVLSHHNPKDGELLEARQVFEVPHGIEDVYPRFRETKKNGSDRVRLLFVGVLRESKGVSVLIEACGLLQKQGLDFEVALMGGFQSREYEQRVMEMVADLGIGDKVRFLGICEGQRKWEAYVDADAFCFPSHYESETFGLVVLEAMQFGLPVVASRWRGIQSLVRHDDTGFLVPPRDPSATAHALKMLILNATLRKDMGARGREVFLKEYTLDQWRVNMESAILTAVNA